MKRVRAMVSVPFGGAAEMTLQIAERHAVEDRVVLAWNNLTGLVNQVKEREWEEGRQQGVVILRSPLTNRPDIRIDWEILV